jgi:hypothetical protein
VKPGKIQQDFIQTLHSCNCIRAVRLPVGPWPAVAALVQDLPPILGHLFKSGVIGRLQRHVDLAVAGEEERYVGHWLADGQVLQIDLDSRLAPMLCVGPHVLTLCVERAPIFTSRKSSRSATDGSSRQPPRRMSGWN